MIIFYHFYLCVSILFCTLAVLKETIILPLSMTTRSRNAKIVLSWQIKWVWIRNKSCWFMMRWKKSVIGNMTSIKNPPAAIGSS